MQVEAKKYLYDMVKAATLAMEFVSGKTFADYSTDAMLRSAVERQLEIAGEALACLARLDPQVAARITDYKRIIGLRNVLVHGYAQVRNHTVWDLLERNVPDLRREASQLLNEV